MSLFNKKSRYLGIDLSTTSVKLVELSRAGQRYQLEGFAVEPIPEGAVENRNPSDAQVVGAAIRKAVRDMHSGLAQAVIAVPTTSVITRVVSLPAELDESRLETTLDVEAGQYIPFPLDEVYLDFEMLGRSRSDAALQELMLVATRRENVDLRQDALREAGLKAEVIDVESYAVENVFPLLASKLPQYGQDARFAVLDVGATYSSLYVLQAGRVVYTREQAFGGDLLTAALAENLGVGRPEAELMKRSGRLGDSFSAEVVTRYRNLLAEQIGQMLQFFFSSSHHSNVEHVVLIGGGALVPGLSRAVGATLQIPTVVGNPFEAMLVAPRLRSRDVQTNAAMFAVACGLALRSFD